MIQRTTMGWAPRTAVSVFAGLTLAGSACTTEVPRSEPEAQAETSEAIKYYCPPGYTAECDCEPEEICSGRPLHCTIKNICSCDCVQNPPFPIPFPPMPSAGGAPLSKLQLVTITYAGDKQWDGTATSALAEPFGDFLVGSQWLQTVTADYRPNPTTSPYVATHLAKVELPPFTGGAVNDIPGLLTQLIASHTVPFPADPTGLVYQIYMPGPGCQTTLWPGSSYHQSFTLNGVPIVYSRICGTAAFLTGNAGPSHEIAEAITNPFGKGYTFDQNVPTMPWFGENEVADACEGIPYSEGGYSLATVWSNTAAAAGGSPCVPKPPSYYNVSPSGPLSWDQWTTTPLVAPAGTPVTVSLTGWTSGGVQATWDMNASVNTLFSDFTPVVTLNGPPGQWNGDVSVGTNTAVTVTLVAPPGTPSGKRAFVDVESFLPGGGDGVWALELEVQ